MRGINIFISNFVEIDTDMEHALGTFEVLLIMSAEKWQKRQNIKVMCSIMARM